MPWSPSQSGNLNPSASRFFGSSTRILDPDNGTNSGIFIPFSSLESYKASTSGDVRELLYSVLDKVHTGIASLSGLPNQPKPSQYSSTRTLASTGDNTSQKRFNVTFDLNASNTVYDVSEE